jgi:Family of unknown function (DUF5681)
LKPTEAAIRRRRTGDAEENLTQTAIQKLRGGLGPPPASYPLEAWPKWKPKRTAEGHKRLATILNEAMQQKLEIQEKGRTRRISVWEAVVRTLRNNALKGDFKAIAFLLAQEPEIARTTEPIPKISADMSAQEAMNYYLRFMKESTGSRA